jgi:hypothetical protein
MKVLVNGAIILGVDIINYTRAPRKTISEAVVITHGTKLV